ncbi:MAG: lysophospholipid acyltransferase family protein [Verrucomicrobiales bacterium]|nr:lysophospholipid acyltransferase family protein [Verrucomicrobiales bacterium]
MSQEPPDLPTAAPPLPRVSPLLVSLFAAYTRWYLPRHLHALRISQEGWQPTASATTARLVYLNHASWWDPLVCLQLQQRFFPTNPSYALIDAEALAKYRFFSRLGFIGVEKGRARGAMAFLHAAEAVVQQPGAMLWITPQARFCDVRQRPLGFQRGLAHVASRLARRFPQGSVECVPLALEYTHWEERTPEALVRFGEPFAPHRVGRSDLDDASWNTEIEGRLAVELDALALQAQRRNPHEFSDLLRGRAGVGGVYDLWRRLRALLRREKFHPSHGSL